MTDPFLKFPNEKGTYTLVLHLAEDKDITIGRKGTSHFPAGYYTYTGSAFGSGGVRGRLKHHLTPARKPHWHIDYFKKEATIIDVWYIASEEVYEHRIAQTLAGLPGASVPAPRTGSTDCNCPAHLIHFDTIPSREWVRDGMGIELLS